MKLTKLFLALAVALLIGNPIGMSSQDIAQQPAYNIVERYDTIPNIALYDTLGNIHYLQELKGKYLLLDFWYGNYAHVEASFAELKKLKDTMGDNVEIVSITLNQMRYGKRLRPSTVSVGTTGTILRHAGRMVYGHDME